VSARSAENQVAGGDLNGFRRKVNGKRGFAAPASAALPHRRNTLL